jgi:hypothetical protein
VETEPISVRVARLRGCEPLFVPANGEDYYSTAMWRCVCKEDGHTPNKATAVLSTNKWEAWLQPAAWALLLSELVAWGCSVEFLPVAVGTVTNEEFVRVRVMLPAEINAEWKRLTVSRPADQVGAAVAECWVAGITARNWRESQR